MKIKAVSTVIASILMLMIVIALGGTTYLFISGTFTSKTATAFEVIDAINDTVIIRNSGTEPITSLSSARLDDSNTVYRISTKDSSLVGYWQMDESSWINDCSTNTVIDSSGNGDDGKSCPAGSGPIGGATGRFGNAGDFDASNDYINILHSSILNGDDKLTYSAWFYARSYSKPHNQIIGKSVHGGGQSRAQMGIWINSDGTIQGRAETNTGRINVIGPVISTNIWYHVALVFNGISLKLYLNGERVAAQSFSATILVKNTDPLRIGCDYDRCGFPEPPTNQNGNYLFDGLIEEVKIYNRALSEQEIKASFNIGSQIDPGEIAAMKVYGISTKGTHTLRLCTSSMCNTAILTIT